MKISGQQPQATIEQYCIESLPVFVFANLTQMSLIMYRYRNASYMYPVRKHGVMIATAWYYRLSLLISLAISTTAAVYMTYFLHRYYNHSPLFHSNLKVLFLALSISCLSSDLVNIAMKIIIFLTRICLVLRVKVRIHSLNPALIAAKRLRLVHHLLMSFLYTTPCHIFLPKSLHIVFVLSYILTHFISQLMLLAVVVERWTAFIFFRSYELGYTKLAPSLITMVVLLSVLLLFTLFYDASFEGLYLNGRMFPTSANYTRTNAMLISLMVINVAFFALTVALHWLSPRHRIEISLSSRFQSSENKIASKLLFWISILQNISLCSTQCAMLYVRIFHSKNPVALAYKENGDFFNLYTLAMPILSTLYFNKVKQQRIKDIKNQVEMKFNGTHGWTNYSAVIERQWN